VEEGLDELAELDEDIQSRNADSIILENLDESSLESELIDLTKDEMTALKNLMNELGFDAGDFDPTKKAEYMKKIDSWFRESS